MRRLNQPEIDAILHDHVRWLNGEPSGKRADFTGTDLTGLNFNFTMLTDAILGDARISNIEMYGAFVKGVVSPHIKLYDFRDTFTREVLAWDARFGKIVNRRYNLAAGGAIWDQMQFILED